jgi:uncharacterized protein
MVSEGLLNLINPLSALVAGLVTSLHCMGMCGPLACAMLGGPSEIRSSKILTFGGYHLGKIVSYMLIGALAGAIGAQFVTKTTAVPAHFLTWSMAIFFLLIAIGLDRIAIKLPMVGKLSRFMMQKAYRIHGGLRGLSLGLATPLIPCGPLYLMVWVAAISGSALEGKTMLGMFGLGTIPGLLVTQLGWSFLTVRVNPDRLARWRRNTAVVACALLVMRSFMDTSFSTIIAGGAICH